MSGVAVGADDVSDFFAGRGIEHAVVHGVFLLCADPHRQASKARVRNRMGACLMLGSTSNVSKSSRRPVATCPATVSGARSAAFAAVASAETASLPVASPANAWT